MTEVFRFHHPTLQDLEAAFESPKGQKVAHEITSEFKSIADLIGHTHPHGNNTVLELPKFDDSAVFVGVSETTFRHDAAKLESYLASHSPGHG